MASYAENVSIWWRHHACSCYHMKTASHQSCYRNRSCKCILYRLVDATHVVQIEYGFQVWNTEWLERHNCMHINYIYLVEHRVEHRYAQFITETGMFQARWANTIHVTAYIIIHGINCVLQNDYVTPMIFFRCFRPHFADDIFKSIVLKGNVCISIVTIMTFVPECSIIKDVGLFQAMA